MFGLEKRSTSTTFLPLCMVLAVVGLAAAPTPGYGAGLHVGIADPVLMSGDPPTRARWFDATVGVGSRIVRLDVVWSAVAASQPADPRNPADPAYQWSAVDAAVRDARARGLQVMLTLSGAPAFAEGKNPPNPDPLHPRGTWKPSPSALRDFAEALATRYSGEFSDGSALLPQALPEIQYIEAWNEPNISLFLNPQWKGMKNKAAPHYRKMVNAVYDGAGRGNPAAKVVAGSTAPFGDDPPSDLRTRPIKFMRELLCVGGGLRRSCKQETKFDVYAHHPINIYGGPRKSGQSPDDASAVVDFKRIERVLRAAEKAKTVTKGRHPLWATEIWWQSDPPDQRDGFTMSAVERYVSESDYLFRKIGVKAAFWYQIVDSPDPPDGLQAGFYFADGSPKPALAALRFPLVVNDGGKGKARVWTVPPASGQVSIERETAGGWQAIKQVKGTARKPLTTKVKLSGRPNLRATQGGEVSGSWKSGGSRSDRVAPRYAGAPVPDVLRPYVESAP